MEAAIPGSMRYSADRPTVACRWPLVVLSGLAVLICTGGPSIYTDLHLVTGPGDRTWISDYPYGAVAASGLILLALQLRSVSARSYPLPLLAVAAYVAWSGVSILWSVSPSITARASILDAGLAAFGCWFGWCLTFHEQVWAVTIGTTTAVLASAWAIRFRPAFGQVYMGIGEDPLWRGIFGNRNSLAPVCVLGLVALVGLVALRPRPLRIAVCGVLGLVHIVLLRGSGGLTSTLALAMMIAVGCVLPGIGLLKRKVPGRVVAGAAVAVAAGAWFAVFANFDRIVTRLGRDPTLTGRRAIWAAARSFIRDRPLHGYGYWALWNRPDLTAESYSRLGQYASAHNSALEVLIGLGVVGLVFFLMISFSAIVGVFMWTWRVRSVASWWWVLIVVFEVAQNSMESFVLWHSYIWILLIAASMVTFGPTARAENSVEGEEGVVGPQPSTDWMSADLSTA